MTSDTSLDMNYYHRNLKKWIIFHFHVKNGVKFPLALSPKMEATHMEISISCGLRGTTSYLYLPLRTIDPPDTRSHPQGGVQIYPHRQKEKKVPSPK